nr:aquaporin-3 [Peronia verruculata]
MSSEEEALINRSTEASSGDRFDTFIRPCIAEFIGVMLFVFIGTSAAVVNGTNIVAIALAHGLTIALLVIATGAISGGHLNPAVTLGIWFAGGISWLQAPFYIISQLVGSILGAALTRGILNEDLYVQGNGGATLPGPGVTAGEGFLCEMLLTSLLVSAVLLSAVDDSSKSKIGPLAIGFAVVTCILAGGPVSGASMNPARSFGPAVVMSHFTTSVWDYHWIYWVGTGCGALLAGAWYRFFLAGPGKRIKVFGN